MHDRPAVSAAQTNMTLRDCILQCATGVLMVIAATLVLARAEVALAAAYAVELDISQLF